MERDIKKCRATSRVPVSGSIAHKVDRGQWSQYSFLSPLIISGPICEVEHRGGAQSPWAVAGCGGGDSRFFYFFFAAAYIPCTSLTPSQACRCAEKSQTWNSLCAILPLIGLQTSLVAPSAPLLSSPPLGFTEAHRNAQRDGHTHRDPLLLLISQRAAAALLLRRLGRQTRLAVRFDSDPAIIVRSLSQSLISFLGSL